MKAPVFFVLLALSPLLAAQTGKHNIRIGFETGVTGYFINATKPVQLREFGSDPYCLFDRINLTLSSTVFGVRPEIFLGRNRWGVSTGLRLSRYVTTFKPDNGPFYWMLAREGLQTDYLTIDKFSQQSYFLGVPLEVRFFTNRRDLPVQIYFKTGATFNYKLRTGTDISFANPLMSKHAGAVGDGLEEVDRFHVYVYPAFGFKIGRYRNGHSPWFNVEISIPGMLFHPNVSSFAKPSAGFGAGFTVQIPLGKMAPIGSN
ncbi:MAG: outer membrane beta-barrel protein [Tannerella sp.]|jgi:hypothetical protein|nr:outer membrane beta-barrel protein [Tannerella sp.]